MSTGMPNRLLNEKSPYLLQHAYNPVDWYPWGSEAFAKAKAEDKPILLSIGYSTCHWCHVMERESFEDPNVAEVMNKFLVCIKLDREERPDIDKIYMTAVSAMTGSGGWPLNVFLTPDLKPFYGGTYFPPHPRWGHPGWTDVVTQIGEAWQDATQRTKVLEVGEQIGRALQQLASATNAPAEGHVEWLDKAFEAFENGFDRERGGFSQAPKFPMPVYHNFLLRYFARTGKREALDMVLKTLWGMAKGGIHDQLGGGFSRYSTDPEWHIPHFEKMLYDNAQLAINFLEAYQSTRDADYARVARETLEYVLRDMRHPEGGFYSAEDADSLPEATATEKREGAFYVWTKDQVQRLLGPKAGPAFCFRYGIRDNGNAAEDPQGEFNGKNILYLAHGIPETAREHQLSEAEAEDLLRKAREMLVEARNLRPRPHLDDKIISAWNGLMISAFARAYVILQEPRYLEAARKAVQFIKEKLYDPQSKTLYRRWREGERQVRGTCDDYAFLTQGLLDLYEADFDPQWLQSAVSLMDVQMERFYDRQRGGFFMTAADAGTDLLVRVKEDMDNVEPSASSVNALNLIRLMRLIEKPEYEEAARKTVACFGKALSETPRAMPQMLVALDLLLQEPLHIVIVGKAGAPDTRALLEEVHRHFLPAKTLIQLEQDGPAHEALVKNLPFLQGMKPIEGKAAAYVCKKLACQAPVTSPAELAALL